MSLGKQFLSELEQESQATKRVLERVPQDKLAWRPHPKSFSLGQLALHIAQGPAQIIGMAKLDSIEVPNFTQEEAKSVTELIDTLGKGLEYARAELPSMDDAYLSQSWTVMANGNAVMAMPRAAVLRTILLNHSYHHRGQLTVYLRLLDVPLPAVYGNSADENPFANSAH